MTGGTWPGEPETRTTDPRDDGHPVGRYPDDRYPDDRYPGSRQAGFRDDTETIRSDEGTGRGFDTQPGGYPRVAPEFAATGRGGARDRRQDETRDGHVDGPEDRRRPHANGRHAPEMVYRPERARVGLLLVAVAIGTFVSIGLGVYGRLHEPTGLAISLAGFSSGAAAKAWLGSGAFVLALVQLATATRAHRPSAPPWLWMLHRWSGRMAVLLTVPVAVYCLYALGFQPGSPRVLAHSLAGCLVYGAFTAKMLVLQRPGAPRWSLPVLGGLLFTAITAVWMTSSLWFFGSSGLTF